MLPKRYERVPVKVSTFFEAEMANPADINNDTAHQITPTNTPTPATPNETKQQVAIMTAVAAVVFLVIGSALFGYAAWDANRESPENYLHFTPPPEQQTDADSYRYGGIACMIMCGIFAMVSATDVYTNGKVTKWAGYE
jgi:hypothetical protein